MGEIYFDHNATTPICDEARAAVLEVLESGPANPSSNHAVGRRARAWIGRAREQVAGLIGAIPGQVFFTSGATEANHLVLESLLRDGVDRRRWITSAVEHSSIMNAVHWFRARGTEVTVLPVDSDGVISPEAVADAASEGPALISIQWANNETGVIQPLAEISEQVRERGGLLHVDAVQAVGKMPVDLADLDIDFLVLASHKLNGPVGAAGLVTARPTLLANRIPGGQQEKGVRPGTENVAAIAGFGAACARRASLLGGWIIRVGSLRDELERRLTSEGIVEAINGGDAPRLANTSNVRLQGIDGEMLLLRLQSAGVACSQGSACTSQKPEPSHVLRAMGLSESEAWSSLRFSLGESNTSEEVDTAVGYICDFHRQLSASTILSPAV